jgi:hypothetical protein
LMKKMSLNEIGKLIFAECQMVIINK